MQSRKPGTHGLPLAVLWIAIAGCGPIANFRPASGLMPEKSLEIGAGAAMVTPRPYVNEDAAGAGQVWVSGELGERVGVSAISAFDTDALGIGGALRVLAVRSDRFAGGVEGEIGYAWGAVSLPLALRLFDQSWLYTAPRLGSWSLEPTFGAGLGASVRVVDGFMLRAEWQRSWQDFKYYNRRDHFGAAIAQQF